MANRPKRPGDFAQRGKLIVDILTGQAPADPPFKPESAKAAIGRKGGLNARIHQTLRVTPAMEAGISDHVWSAEEIARLAE